MWGGGEEATMVDYLPSLGDFIKGNEVNLM